MSKLKWNCRSSTFMGSPPDKFVESPLRSLLSSSWFVFGFFLIFFSALYASTLTTDYGFLDDYPILVKGPEGHPTKRLIMEGRPLRALSLYLYLQVAKDIEDLRYGRFAGILSVTLLAWVTFGLFIREGWRWFQSICVSVIICTTLPLQVSVAWVTGGFLLFAAFVSGCAFFLSDRAFQIQRSRLKWLLTAGAILLLLTALMIYQPAAMFFWVFAAVVLLKPETPVHDILRRFGWYGLIASVGMLLGFATYLLGPVLYPDSPPRTGLVQNLPIKIAWFLIESFPNALLFTFLSPAWSFLSDGSEPLSFFYRIVDIGIAWTLFLIIVLGLVLYFEGPCKERLWKCGIAVVLLILSYAPNFVVAENWATYRSLSGLASLVVVLLCLGLRGYVHHRGYRLPSLCTNLIVGCVATLNAVSAAYHVRTYFVMPQAREVAFMRAELMKKPLSQAQGIYVIGSTKGDTLAPLRRYEFGTPSSSDTVVARSMAILLIREKESEEVEMPITAVAADALINPPPTSLVVDMRRLGLLSLTSNKSSTYWKTYRRYLNPFRGQATFGAP